MPIVLQIRIHEKDIIMNPNVWYLYTLSEKQEVSASNIVILRIKKSLTSYWSDLTYEENCAKVKEDISKVESILKTQSILVISPEMVMDFISELEEHCPKTKKFIQEQIERVMKKYDQRS
jgi:hypothetical protein|tara:strand:- start:1362 stop:1721 length:360 start_codon:yes stop_codon:yes gene_type:complete